MLSSYERTVRWRANIKHNLILACGGHCRLCSYSKCEKSLEFHHLDPKTKDFRISSKIRSEASLIAEVKKCILLCANCHREVHAGVQSCEGILPIFDDSVFRQEPLKSPCMQCGQLKRRALKFCSTKCASIQRSKVSWTEIDLHDLLLAENFNVSKVADSLGISHAAVKKRMRVLGIQRPT